MKHLTAGALARPPRTMIVAGVMSGTSADGIDVALTRISPAKDTCRIQLLAHEGYAYPAALRRAVLAAMNAQSISAAELARLNWRLGVAYAEAVCAAREKHGIPTHLIGCHGQTVYHQGATKSYLGRSFACTWQLGEPAVVAGKTGTDTVSNFRPADMAAGGQGAPLVPFLDYTLFRNARRGRMLQNLGGIGNMTVIPAGAAAEQVIAFDTGPANMVIDALMQHFFKRKFDRNGAVAARGRVIGSMVKHELKQPYYRQAPPKSAGREEYGSEYVERFLADCKRHRATPEDAIATATAITAATVAHAYQHVAAPILGVGPADLILSGGGAKNKTLRDMLAARMGTNKVRLGTSEEMGLPVEAKEAVAFALLAWRTWHGLPSNLPTATGASSSRILGQISYA